MTTTCWIGVIGLLLPTRTAGWLGRRIMVRRSFPTRRVQRVPVSYVTRDVRASELEPSRPTLLDQDVVEEPAQPTRTEVVEDLYEQP